GSGAAGRADVPGAEGPGTGMVAVRRARRAGLLVHAGADGADDDGAQRVLAARRPFLAARRRACGPVPRPGRLGRLERLRRPGRERRGGAGAVRVHGGDRRVRAAALAAVPAGPRPLARALPRAVRTRLAERADPGAGAAVHRHLLDGAAAL